MIIGGIIMTIITLYLMNFLMENPRPSDRSVPYKQGGPHPKGQDSGEKTK